jgi:hypothetical protein
MMATQAIMPVAISFPTAIIQSPAHPHPFTNTSTHCHTLQSSSTATTTGTNHPLQQLAIMVREFELSQASLMVVDADMIHLVPLPIVD